MFVYEKEGRFIPVQTLHFLPCRSTVQGKVMDSTQLFKIRKIHNHRCLVAAESQVDEIGYLCKAVAFCCGLELHLFIG